MVVALGLAIGLVIGVPFPALAALSLAVWQPIWALGAVGAWVGLSRSRRRPITDAQEATYLQAVAGELRAGSSLRHALGAVDREGSGPALRQVARLAAAGQPLDRIGGELEIALPRLGELTASAVRSVGGTGGRAADVFDGLALLAVEEIGLVRERRAATAQARFSAWIVGGLPVVYLLYAGVTGRLSALLAIGPIGVVLLGLGLVLLGAGVTAIWATLRRAER